MFIIYDRMLKIDDQIGDFRMIRDITIGQYYSGESVIHRMDPRTKLAITFVYAISLFLCKDWIMILTATVFLCTYVVVSRVPLTYICKGLKVIWMFIFFTAIFSVFNGDGNVIWSWHRLRITDKSVMTTVLVVVRLVYLIIGSSVMTYTTRPMNLANGLESSLGFLKKVKVPVAEMAMMLMIALRFIPIFMEELDKIMKAQLSRGADFESGNIFRRIKSYVPVFVPLFVSAIRRAIDLAQAMDARCFDGSEGRSRMNPLKYSGTDYVGYAIVLMYLGCMIVYRCVL